MLIKGKFHYNNLLDVILDYENKVTTRNTEARYKMTGDENHPDGWLDTTVGRLVIYHHTEILIDYTLDKHGVSKLMAEISRLHTPKKAAVTLKKLQDLILDTVTQYGLSLCYGDMEKSSDYKEVLKTAYTESMLVEGMDRAKVWDDAINGLTDDWVKTAPDNNPMKVMMKSGARVTDTQVRQMIIAKGLLTTMTGKLQYNAVYNSLSDGLDPHQYFQTAGPARKGLAGNFFVVPASGYLERQLVSAARDLTITSDDCGTEQGIFVPRQRAYCRYLAGNNILVTTDMMMDLEEEVFIRSPITCEHNKGLCKKCCGLNPAYESEWWMNVGIGVMAAQTLAEPATQLGLRGKHTSGSVTLKSFSTKLDDTLADIIKQLGAAATTTVKVGESPKKHPSEIAGATYEDRATTLINNLISTYEGGGIKLAPIYYEVIVRSISDVSDLSDGTCALRSRGYKDPNPKIRGVTSTISAQPSWLKGMGFGYVKRVLNNALATIEPSMDLPSELLMEGRIV